MCSSDLMIRESAHCAANAVEFRLCLNSGLICRRRISPILPNEHPFPYRLAHEVISGVKHKSMRDSYLRLVIDTGLKCRTPLRQLEKI